MPAAVLLFAHLWAAQEAVDTDTSTAAYEITVVATRLADTAGSAHILRAKQLERFEYDDPHSVLSFIPGIYTRGEDGAGLRPNIGLRGGNPDRSKKVVLMEDGVLFGPAPYSAPAAYFFPLMTRMQQVRVIKGPAAISYGPHTVGGAVDLVTRTFTSSRTAGLDLAGGQYLYGKAHGWFGWDDGRFGFLIEGAHLREDGFKTLYDDSNTGFFRNEVMLKSYHAFDTGLGSRNELQLKATYSDERSRETYLGLRDDDLRSAPDRRYSASQLDTMNWHRTSVVLSHLLELGEHASLTTDAYRHDFDRTWRKVNGFRGANLFEVLTQPGDGTNDVYYAILTGASESSTPDETLLIGPNHREFVSEGIQSRFRLDARTGPIEHRVEAGARLHYDRIERRHSEDGFLVRGDSLIPEGSPTVVTAFNEASTIAGAGHLTAAMSWQHFTLTPGVRLEIVRSKLLDLINGGESRRLLSVILPGAAGFYRLTEDLGVFAGVHRGFSPPPPGADVSIKPEKSWNYEAGARYTHGRLRVEAIGFYNDYQNLTDVCTFSSGCLDADLDRQFDAGQARIYGLEAYGEHRFALGGGFAVPVNVAYTYTRATFDNAFESDDPIFGRVEAGDEIPYVPRHNASVSLGVEYEKSGVIAKATYVSAMREEAGSEPIEEALATDEQFIIDAAATYQLTESIGLYLNLRNLLDSRELVSRRPFGARPNAPRWVQLGLKVAAF